MRYHITTSWFDMIKAARLSIQDTEIQSKRDYNFCINHYIIFDS